jgi:Ni/Fe-hydrogenase subunit HybB-like protein
VVLHRLNVAWFGMLPAAGVFYVPSWQELAITVGLVSVGVIVFGLVARYMPLFHYEEHAAQRGPTSLAGMSRR